MALARFATARELEATIQSALKYKLFDAEQLDQLCELLREREAISPSELEVLLRQEE